MPFRYQIALELEGKRSVVVGGGRIGEHKVQALLDADATVTVVSALVTPGLSKLASDGAITLVRREYRDGDLDGAFLAIAATDDEAVNEQVFREAERSRVLLNTVDDIARSHFAVPAVVRRGELRVAISTGGKAPALAKRLREHLEQEIGPEWGKLIEVLGDARKGALPRTVAFDEWARRWQHALDLDLLGMIRDGRTEDARTAIDACLAGLSGTVEGRVTLVGAGPGDPDLITVKGRRALDSADVIVHDRLAHFTPSDMPSIDVGKRAGGSSFEQDAINQLLIALAGAGLRVVRLKGGDPFVFGRGGEEVSALQAAGIDCDVVPAPSSATAVPAAAGIPVTDRRVSRSFAVVTGHDVASIDWHSLGADTLVVLMGTRTLSSVCQSLIDAGRDGSTPAAMIADGTLPTQRVALGDLAMFASGALPVTTQPHVLVVGDVVSFATAGTCPPQDFPDSRQSTIVALIAPAGHQIDAPAMRESVSLQTCERTEIYGILDEPINVEGVRTLIGADAVKHLFRVASGLESRAIGEQQILGQVRRALKIAKEAGTAGPVLCDAFARAIATGRRVRARTALGSFKHGIGRLVVARLSIGGSPVGGNAVVIGSGEAAFDVAQALSDLHLSVSIAGRSVDSAQRVARKCNGSAHDLATLSDLLVDADLAVVAVSGGIVLEPKHVADRAQPLRVIDVSVPSAVTPGDGLLIETLDDLESDTPDDLIDAVARAEMFVEEALGCDDRAEGAHRVPTQPSVARS